MMSPLAVFVGTLGHFKTLRLKVWGAGSKSCLIHERVLLIELDELVYGFLRAFHGVIIY